MLVEDHGSCLSGWISTSHGLFAFCVDFAAGSREVDVTQLQLDGALEPLLVSGGEGMQALLLGLPCAALTKSAFPQSLQLIVSRLLGSPPPVERWQQRIVGELDRIGWAHVGHISPSWGSISLHMVDPAHRAHQLHITLQPRSAQPPSILCSLPVQVWYDWRPGCRLHYLWDRFCATVSSLQPLLEVCTACFDPTYYIQVNISPLPLHSLRLYLPLSPSGAGRHRPKHMGTGACA
jgi:hypothetical protein